MRVRLPYAAVNEQGDRLAPPSVAAGKILPFRGAA
jgi:hypothetical protein